MSQDLTKGTFWQKKVRSEIFTEKERPSCCEQLQKIEEIIFTNNKDMSF